MQSVIRRGIPRHSPNGPCHERRPGASPVGGGLRKRWGAAVAAFVLVASLGATQGAWAAEAQSGSASAAAVPGSDATSSPITAVRVTTSMGAFVIELNAERAPLTVKNFLRYVNEGFYTNTLFHRVVGGFVVQGGGYDATTMKTKPTHEYLVNESGNGLQNKRGSVGMARSGPPHSANSQFYVNLVDNSELDPLPTRWGYAVFGEITEGMDVIERIGVVATGPVGPFKSEAPLEPIVIEKIEPLASAPAPAATPPATAPPSTPPGEESGETSGDSAGDDSGGASGEASGSAPGNTSAEASGDASGNTSTPGSPSGEASGDASGEASAEGGTPPPQ